MGVLGWRLGRITGHRNNLIQQVEIFFEIRVLASSAPISPEELAKDNFEKSLLTLKKRQLALRKHNLRWNLFIFRF